MDSIEVAYEASSLPYMKLLVNGVSFTQKVRIQHENENLIAKIFTK
jgi:hypothetical protein